MAIVPVGMGGVWSTSGLPLGPYCPMKEPSSVKRPARKKKGTVDSSDPYAGFRLDDSLVNLVGA